MYLVYDEVEGCGKCEEQEYAGGECGTYLSNHVHDRLHTHTSITPLSTLVISLSNPTLSQQVHSVILTHMEFAEERP